MAQGAAERVAGAEPADHLDRHRGNERPLPVRGRDIDAVAAELDDREPDARSE
jgi:hypothetical protein